MRLQWQHALADNVIGELHEGSNAKHASALTKADAGVTPEAPCPAYRAKVLSLK